MKINQTLKEYKCAVFSIGCAAAIPLTFFLSTLMDKRCAIPLNEAENFSRCGNPIINWIYDFQTLLVGFFATVVAIATILISSKNHRELMYVEWRTLVFKAMFMRSQITMYIDTLNQFTAPASAVPKDWYEYMIRLIKELKHLRSVLVGIDQLGLSPFAMSYIPSDIERVETAINVMSASIDRIETSKERTIHERTLSELRTVCSQALALAKNVDQHTGFALDVFIANTKNHNPMTLKF